MAESGLNILVVGRLETHTHVCEELEREAPESARHVDWLPETAEALDAILRAEHHVYLLEETGDGKAQQVLEQALLRGVRSPLLIVSSDEDTQLDALRDGATDVLGLDGGGSLARRVHHAVVKAWRAATAFVPADDDPSGYAKVVMGCPDGLIEWSLNGEDTVTFSPRFKAQLGLADSELEPTWETWMGLVHDEDRKRVKRQLLAYVQGRTPHLETYHRVKHRHGDYRWVIVRGQLVRDAAGEPQTLVAVQTDITAGTQTMGQAAVRELHDRLTGLPSRAILLDRLNQCVARKQRNDDYQFAVLSVDVDRFGMINNSLGHVIGDQLLCEIARRILSCVRTGDTVARTGSDDFAVLLDGVADLDEAKAAVAKIHDAMRLPFRLGGHEVYSSASIGIAMSRSRYDQAEELLRDAQLALRNAKRQGGSRHEIFNTSMHMNAMQNQLLEMSLRRAIDGEQLRVHYQPIIDLKSGRVAGFEALVRWEHPVRGLLSPKEFIPIAEDSDLIVDLGRWMLESACVQARQWEQTYGRAVLVNVNIAARHFRNTELIDHVATALEASKLDAGHLRLEITESGLMEHVGTTVPVLRWLKNMGVGVQIDDFGTGYSSLSYLTHLPVSALKVDRSFTKAMMESHTQAQIVQAIVSLARTLSLQVTAEGVEEQAQLRELKALGCDFAQGLLWGLALPSEDAEAMLKASGEGPVDGWE